MNERILVAGVGNIFLGDDGFGVEVARRLAGESLPGGARVRDFGIRGIHLAYHLLDGFEMLILVDALPRGEPPGTLYVFEPAESDPAPRAETFVDAHGLDPVSVLAMVRLLGGSLGRTVVVGCEPGEIVERIGLSPPVSLAVDAAVRLVRSLVAGHKREEERTTC
jgi:hydrogenase maturation protease